jgi:hypothetical protein
LSGRCDGFTSEIAGKERQTMYIGGGLLLLIIIILILILLF